ncbi:elastase-1-like [Symsagittifera roscoffensis]|uniref:elastase-1-like n=1 Tax=Symsagittifera roscoffensis TaxID=84072 RepID=UPI00307BCF0F
MLYSLIIAKLSKAWIMGPYYSCGGSLISQWFVLTAAHCIHNEKGWQIQYSA